MIDDEKSAAAAAAVAEVADGMLVGLGTGSTAAWAIRHLAARVAAGLSIRAVATSEASAALARSLGIEVLEFAEVDRLDLTIDGTDEIDPRFFAIKGAGGAMLREKVVAAASRRMVVIADASKRVGAIGHAKLPVEILGFARASIMAALGPIATIRLVDGVPFVTDGGNLIADCVFEGGLSDPRATARWLEGIPGVLGHGLFLDEVDAAYVAEGTVVTHLERQGASR